MTGGWPGAITWNGLLRPLCPAPSSARKTRFDAIEVAVTAPVQTPCAKLPETTGVIGTALDGLVEPLRFTVPLKPVTIPLVALSARTVTGNGALVNSGDGI